MSALRGDDVPPAMVRISGPVPRTASVGVRRLRSQVQDACLALSLIDRPSPVIPNFSAQNEDPSSGGQRLFGRMGRANPQKKRPPGSPGPDGLLFEPAL